LGGRPGESGHKGGNVVRMSGWNIGTGRTFDVEPQQGDVQRPVRARENLALKDGLHKRHEDEVPHAAHFPTAAPTLSHLMPVKRQRSLMNERALAEKAQEVRERPGLKQAQALAGG
jgi:hypothetical protein